MNNEPGTFQWSAFDRNRCDHFYHNGQQVRFYRVRPWAVSQERFEPTLLERVLAWVFGR